MLQQTIPSTPILKTTLAMLLHISIINKKDVWLALMDV
jgi:hypothetical protein